MHRRPLTQQMTRRGFLLLTGTLLLTACGATVTGKPAAQPETATTPASTALPTATGRPAAIAATPALPATAQAPLATAQIAAAAPLSTATPQTTGAPSLSTAMPTASAAAALPTATAPMAGAQATPVCTAGAVTPSQTEGPYYKANPPEQSTLLQPGMSGTKLTITGYVLTADCKPVPGARVDFWQADANGTYDNSGYTLRGYELTDASGAYSVTTVVPGLYPGRTRHIHVKVSAPNGPVLTTQLYFPGEAANNRDGIYDARLLLNIQPTADGDAAAFNFVLAGS